MTAVIGYYDISNVERRTKITEDKFKVINTALVSYLARNGRLPCPAPLDCDLEGCNNDNIYDEKILGLEFRKDKDIDKECISDNNGVFESKNDVGEKLLYGNVPALSLGLDNNYLIDDWGNKLVYIVPDILTQENALKDILINQNTETRDPTISDEYVKDGEIFLLLSSNTNTQGAYAFDNRENNNFSNKITQEVTNEDGTTTTITKEVNNLPEKDFKVDLNDEKYLKYHRNIDNIHNAFSSDSGNGGSVSIAQPNCPESTYDIQILVPITESVEGIYEKGDTIPIGKKVGDKIEVNDSFTFKCIQDSQTLQIPKAVTSIYVDVYGAQGGSATGRYKTETAYCNDNGGGQFGGRGGRSYGRLNTTDEFLQSKVGIKNRKLLVYVGCKGSNINHSPGGWPDGGHSDGGSGYHEGSGGGSSDLRTTSNPSTRIIVAGGGGGASIPDERGGGGGGGNNRGEKGYQGFVRGTMTLGWTRGGCSINDRDSNGVYSSECNSSYVEDNKHRHGGGGFKVGADNWGNQTAQGGGSGFINTSLFTNSGGQTGVYGTNRVEKNICGNDYNYAYHGQVIVKYLAVSDSIVSKDKEYNYTIYFPEAQYGETVESTNECPKMVGGSSINPDYDNPQAGDYYTLSNNRDAEGNIISNRLQRTCGTNGQVSEKPKFECILLKRCENPVTKFPNINWGQFNYDIVNTGIITGKDKKTGATVKYQCIVNVDANGSQSADYYKI